MGCKMTDLAPIWAFVHDDSYLNSQIAQIALRNSDEVLYCFANLSVKFQSHTGLQIDDFMDLNPIWAILLG